MATSIGKPVIKIPDLNQIGALGGFDVLKKNQPYITDLVTLETLYFQTVPVEINDSSDAGWGAVATVGRNLPLYQYTGSEDTIQFTLTWYADALHKEDALRRCRWLKALEKNNGYIEKPHPIKFVMGQLFKKSKFIVHSAAFKMAMFDRENNMMPCLCTQDITLKRTSEGNPKRIEMLDISY